MSSQLEAIEEQYESVSELFRLMQTACVSKCVKPSGSYVQVGEALCLDRCVAKFFGTSEAISKVMNTFRENQERQAQAAQQVAGGTGSFSSMLGL